jgi:hypothetical protein
MRIGVTCGSVPSPTVATNPRKHRGGHRACHASDTSRQVASIHEERATVCVGSFVTLSNRNVCLSPKADIREDERHVSFGPKAAIGQGLRVRPPRVLYPRQTLLPACFLPHVDRTKQTSFHEGRPIALGGLGAFRPDGRHCRRRSKSYLRIVRRNDSTLGPPGPPSFQKRSPFPCGGVPFC